MNLQPGQPWCGPQRGSLRGMHDVCVSGTGVLLIRLAQGARHVG
ncbi:hypothetical protein [Aquabacterium sp. OR-4]|nr:hypothetical protein [Aquabacterium sp. OR-4]MDT7838442.1 hypothetical protein [Aquabacterium sp. OR-4]